jgi:hypothetical protein
VLNRPPASVTQEAQRRQFLFHDCSTLGGNSGSPVIDLKTGEVLGIHFAGEFEQTNWAWSAWRIRELPKVKEILDKAKPKKVRDAAKRPRRTRSTRRVLPPPVRARVAARRGNLSLGRAIQPRIRPAQAGGRSKAGSNAGIPELREGVPLWVGIAAKECAFRFTGKHLTSREALKFLRQQKAFRSARSGASIPAGGLQSQPLSPSGYFVRSRPRYIVALRLPRNTHPLPKSLLAYRAVVRQGVTPAHVDAALKRLVIGAQKGPTPGPWIGK